MCFIVQRMVFSSRVQHKIDRSHIRTSLFMQDSEFVSTKLDTHSCCFLLSGHHQCLLNSSSPAGAVDLVLLIRSFPAMFEALGATSNVLVHSLNLSSWEVEARGSFV